MKRLAQNCLPIKRLILTPFEFLIQCRKDRKEFNQTQIGAQKFYRSEKVAILTSFLGYPALLTTLQHLREIPIEETFFLGTAGILEEPVNCVETFAISQVSADSQLEKLFPQSPVQLKTKWTEFFKPAKAITTDLTLRQDQKWLEQNRQRGKLVEMELFPLCTFFKLNSLYAFLVTSDRLTAQGTFKFPFTLVKAQLKSIFNKIIEYCNEKI